MDSTKELTEKCVSTILQRNQQKTPFKVSTYVNSNIEFILVQLKSISSTMILSSDWEMDLLTKERVFIFRADEQTKGKGQKSNSWNSPEGNLYMTILTQVQLNKLQLLTIYATTQICQIIEELFQISPSVKWINDIFVNNAKIGGILVKSQIFNKRYIAEIGIGINVANSPSEGATYLMNETQKKIQLQQLCYRLSLKVSKDLMKSTDFHEQTIKKYKKRLIYFNEEVKIFDEKLENCLYRGIFVDVNKYGFAVVKLQTGEIKEVKNGRMRKY